MLNLDIYSIYRYAISFDRLFNNLEKDHSQSNSYPPYNVELVDVNNYKIAIAVAGFCKNELKISFIDNILVVKGANLGVNKKYIYQGIEKRNFERKFQLADNINISNANLINGILYINLNSVITESKKPRRIEIN